MSWTPNHVIATWRTIGRPPRGLDRLLSWLTVWTYVLRVCIKTVTRPFVGAAETSLLFARQLETILSAKNPFSQVYCQPQLRYRVPFLSCYCSGCHCTDRSIGIKLPVMHRATCVQEIVHHRRWRSATNGLLISSRSRSPLFTRNCIIGLVAHSFTADSSSSAAAAMSLSNNNKTSLDAFM